MNRTLIVFCTSLLLSTVTLPSGAFETVAAERLRTADALAQKGENVKAELMYRTLLNDVQLEHGFGSRDAVPVLDSFAKALKANGKEAEAKDAEWLSKQISAGLVPILPVRKRTYVAIRRWW